MEINEYFSNSLVDAAEVRAHCKLSSAEVHDRAQLEAQGKFAVFAAQVRKMQALLDVFADATAENVAVSPSSIAAHTHTVSCRVLCSLALCVARIAVCRSPGIRSKRCSTSAIRTSEAVQLAGDALPIGPDWRENAFSPKFACLNLFPAAIAIAAPSLMGAPPVPCLSALRRREIRENAMLVSKIA